MRWTVHSEEPLYRDEWLDIRIADVELPGGRRLDHRLIRRPPGAGSVVTDARGRVLLLWRHRFITDTWGYEIPMGAIEGDETPVEAAARETEEETGWRPEHLKALIRFHPTPGLSDGEHHIFHTDHATRIGPPQDAFESERVEWLPLAEVSRQIAAGRITAATTLTALLYLLMPSR